MKRNHLGEPWLRKWERVGTVLYWLGQSGFVLAIVAVVVSFWVEISSRWAVFGAVVGFSCWLAWLLVHHHQCRYMVASLEQWTDSMHQLVADMKGPRKGPS